MTNKKLRPEKTGRFQRGRSGNPAGRPRGSRNKVSLLVEHLILEDAEAITAKLIAAAKRGNTTAGLAILRTLLGPARERSMPLQFKMPQLKTPADALLAIGAIANGLATGTLDADGAKALTTVVTEFRAVHAAVNQEQRIVALEATAKAKTGQGR